MSDSTWDDPRITAYVLDELSGEDRTAFESDCENHPALAAAVDEARGVTGQLQELYACESTPPLDPERRDAIVGRDTSVTLASSEASAWRVPALVLAAAAVLLLLIGIAPMLRQKDSTVVMEDRDPQKSGAELKTEAAAKVGDAETQELELRASSQPADVLAGSVKAPLANRPEGELAQADSQPRSSGPAAPGLASGLADSSAPAAAGAAAPARAAATSAEAKRGRGKVADSPQAAPLAAEARQYRAAAPTELSLQGSKQQAEQASDDSYQMPGQARPQSSDYEVPLDRQAGAADKARNLRGQSDEDVAPVPSELNGVKRSQEPLAEVKDTINKLEKQSQMQRSRGTTASPAPAAGPAPAAAPAPKPQAGRELKQIEGNEKSLAMKSQNGAPVGGGVALGRSVRRGVPVLGKDPAIKRDGFGAAIPDGRGPGIPGDQFDPITDNAFKRVSEEPLSTFSVDVDTASYSKTRDFLVRANQLPRPDAVRIEELINYFEYDYKAPKPDAEHPFVTHVEVTTCPWNTDHRLARIGLKGKTMTAEQRPQCNLVFLLDTSGSMNAPNKLPLVIEGMQMLIGQLNENDKVAITVYAGSAGLVLDSTRADKSKKIRKALTQLRAGGSTNGGAGIALAYQTARSNFISNGVNRVILCTDGDFNVGVTGTDSLVRMVEQEAKGGVFLSVLGFGMGNHNDAMLEKVSGRGNGNYAFIDTRNEAHKVLVDQTSGTLVTIAKDVKLQVEFNPKHVGQYRLIGYENRVLAKEDFNDDKKDAGEIGAGHAVTALYELVPPGEEADASQPKVDDLKYQSKSTPTEAADSDELFTLKLRYKQPDGDESTLVEIPVENKSVGFDKASDDVRFAAAVAGFGMQLRRSQYVGSWTLSDVEQVAKSAKGEDDYELREEFFQLVRKASELMGAE